MRDETRFQYQAVRDIRHFYHAMSLEELLSDENLLHHLNKKEGVSPIRQLCMRLLSKEIESRLQ